MPFIKIEATASNEQMKEWILTVTHIASTTKTNNKTWRRRGVAMLKGTAHSFMCVCCFLILNIVLRIFFSSIR